MTNPNDEWAAVSIVGGPHMTLVGVEKDGTLRVNPDVLRKYQKELLAAHDAELVRRIEELRRTDETQMSQDHVYDEALDDVLSIIRKESI